MLFVLKSSKQDFVFGRTVYPLHEESSLDVKDDVCILFQVLLLGASLALICLWVVYKRHRWPAWQHSHEQLIQMISLKAQREPFFVQSWFGICNWSHFNCCEPLQSKTWEEVLTFTSAGTWWSSCYWESSSTTSPPCSDQWWWWITFASLVIEKPTMIG